MKISENFSDGSEKLNLKIINNIENENFDNLYEKNDLERRMIRAYILYKYGKESIIDENLRNKYDNINKSVSLIKGNDKISEKLDKNLFEEIVKLRNIKISNFDLDRKLIEAGTEFAVIKEKYKDELNKSEEIKNIAKRLEELDEKFTLILQGKLKGRTVVNMK